MKKVFTILFMFVMLSSIAFGALPDGLYSHIKFENSSLVDEFGYANQWSVYNSPSFVTGKLGNAIYFDPNSEDIVVYYGTGDPLSPDNIYESQFKTNGGSFNVWFNIDSFNTSMQYGNNWGFIYGGRQEDYVGCTNGMWGGVSLSIIDVGLQETAKIYFAIPDPSWPSNGLEFNNIMLGELQTDTWYMATVTHDANTHVVKLYINGVEKASGSYNPTTQGKADYCSWYFGNGPNNGIDGGNNYAFPGSIDSFKVWNRPLSAVEVPQLYSFENAGTDTPYCTPDWSCNAYGTCQQDNTKDCISVTDLNTCGESYGGDYSEFTPQACDYCTPNWDCIGYGKCISRRRSCDTVQDLNHCNENYNGDYSEFDKKVCSDVNDGGSAATGNVVIDSSVQTETKPLSLWNRFWTWVMDMLGRIK